MGEFSSGKTLLLGSLIGYADALPVSETPTTGNVTAIYLVQQQGFQTTQVNKFTVEYLSQEEVKTCLSFMLKEAQERAIAAGIPEAQLATVCAWTKDDLELDSGGIPGEVSACLRVYAKIDEEVFPGRVLFRSLR